MCKFEIQKKSFFTHSTVKGKNHPHNVDIAGKDGGRVQLHQDGGRVQLHQDGQEDVGKASFQGQFAPIRPVSAVFSARNAYQTTKLGVVSVGKG